MADSHTEEAEGARPSRTGSASNTSGRVRGGRRRPGYVTKDLTRGSIPRNLWFLSWPQIAESFLSVVDQLADLIWAGRIGFQAIAGLGVAQTFLMLLMTARMGLDAGMRSMISRAVGARQVAHANHVMLQALTLTTVYSIILVTVGMILTEPLLRIMGIGDEVVTQAAGYMRFQLIAMSMMGIQRLTAGGLQASGDSITPLKAASVSRVLHLVLSPFLIFGWLWFPSLELAGAGAANLIAQTVGVGMNMSALIRGTSRLKLSFSGYYIDYPMIWRILKIGIPASVTGAQRAVSQLIVVFIVAPFGSGALAAFALSRRGREHSQPCQPRNGTRGGGARGPEPRRRIQGPSQTVGNLGVGLCERRECRGVRALPGVPGDYRRILQLGPRFRGAGFQVAPDSRHRIPVHERGAGIHAGVQHDGRHVRAHGHNAFHNVAG